MAADSDRQKMRAKARADIQARAAARDANRTPRKRKTKKQNPMGLRTPSVIVKPSATPKPPVSSIGGTMNAIQKRNKRLRDT